MTSRSNGTMPRRRSFGHAVRKVAVRVAFWGGLAALAFLLFGDPWTLLPLRSPTGQVDQQLEPAEFAGPADPGWPHRRGPRYDAISNETDLADSWPPEGPPVLWTLELGRGYSGFTAVGNRVYTQTQSLTAQSVVCLDGDTGARIWRHDYAWPYEAAGMYPGPRATPSFNAGRVYFAGPDALVGCLRASDGRPFWSVNVNEKFGGRGTDFGYACSPLVEGGRVIMPVGGKGASVVALRAQDGSTLWASGDEPASYCSAIPITFQGRRCVVAFLQNVLSIFDLETGRLLWQERYSRGYDEHAAAPLYHEPYLMVACPFRGGADCYRLAAVETESAESGAGQDETPAITGTLVWHTRELSNDTASSVLVDGYVYGFDLRDVQAKAHRPSRGKFKCLDLTTGKVLWSTDRAGHATVIAADEKLILFNDKGELLLARASPNRYEELARTQVFGGEICWTAPALDHGRLYLRSPSKAACVYVGKPEDLGQERLARARRTSEIPKPTRLDLARLVGGERQYAFDPPDLHELSIWYGFSLLGVLGIAVVIAGVIGQSVRLMWPDPARRTSRIVFWCAAFLLGAAGTPVYNRLWDQFVFTWPVCLFVAHQLALTAIVWASREPGVRTVRWVSLLAVLFFLGVCLSYFLVCRRLSLAIEWVFLLGFLPSWPIAVPAAYRLQCEARWPRDLFWTILSFSAYFWAAGGLILWKMATLE